MGTGISTTIFEATDFWEFDPENNTWTPKTDFGGLPGVFGVGFSIEERGYLFIGGLRNDF